MRITSTIAVVGFACSIAILAGPVLTARARAQPQAPTTRTVFASVLAKDGSPVTDLEAAEFEVREGGRPQPIASVALATMPLRVHVIVSDGGSGAFQLGVLRLAQALGDRAEFALTSVLVQPERVLDFTKRPDLFGAAIQQFGRRGAGQGRPQLMSAIADALNDLAAEEKHPVLIVLRIGNEEPTPTPAAPLRESLRKTGATMYVISRAGASRPAATTAGVNNMTAEAARRQLNDDEVADAALSLNLVLGDGSRESGGYHEETSLTTAVPSLERLALEINSQYQITYTLPAGAKLSDRLQVTTKRRNVTLRAPQRVPN